MTPVGRHLRNTPPIRPKFIRTYPRGEIQKLIYSGGFDATQRRMARAQLEKFLFPYPANELKQS